VDITRRNGSIQLNNHRSDCQVIKSYRSLRSASAAYSLIDNIQFHYPLSLYSNIVATAITITVEKTEPAAFSVIAELFAVLDALAAEELAAAAAFFASAVRRLAYASQEYSEYIGLTLGFLLRRCRGRDCTAGTGKGSIAVKGVQLGGSSTGFSLEVGSLCSISLGFLVKLGGVCEASS
jgi:hypothetical protein